MPEAFQPVDHLVVSRAESLAKESLKTVRQLPETPSGPPDAGVLVVLEELGAGVDVLVGGTVGVDPELGVEVGVGVDGEVAEPLGDGVDEGGALGDDEDAEGVEEGAELGCVEVGDGDGRW
jgi:hypothetical protein